MELFVVDTANSNRRLRLIEQFDSFVWTDRYNDIGDFQLVANPTADLVARLTVDSFVGFDESNRMMQVMSANRIIDEEGKRKLLVKGRSYEGVLEDRAARVVLSEATWDLTGTAGNIVATMVNTICVAGTGISASDVISNLTTTDSSGTVTSLTISIKAGSLLERIQEICKAFDLGFRITFTPNTATLAFVVYAGTDRSGVGGVTFSEELDNLSATSYFVSKEKYKNVAYVFAPNGSRIVYATGASGATVGPARRVLLVDATDITEPAGATLNAILDQRGLDELSKCKETKLFDGTVNPNVAFKYNRDYFLGDLVALRGDDGVRETRRVTEHIWSYDTANGFQSFPTLSSTGGV